MKRLTEYTIPETGFSVISQEKYKRILMDEKPSVEKIYNRLKKIEDILGDEYELERLQDGQLLEILQQVPGVGVKVADCVCLFGLHKLDAFPIDTHIRLASGKVEQQTSFPKDYVK